MRFRFAHCTARYHVKSCEKCTSPTFFMPSFFHVPLALFPIKLQIARPRMTRAKTLGWILNFRGSAFLLLWWRQSWNRAIQKRARKYRPRARPNHKKWNRREPSGTHKRTYRIRSKVHSRIGSTQNSVYSIYFYNFQEKQELHLHELGL